MDAEDDPKTFGEALSKAKTYAEFDATPDTWSSRSRQHYIDTGEYMTILEVRQSYYEDGELR